MSIYRIQADSVEALQFSGSFIGDGSTLSVLSASYAGAAGAVEFQSDISTNFDYRVPFIYNSTSAPLVGNLVANDTDLRYNPATNRLQVGEATGIVQSRTFSGSIFSGGTFSGSAFSGSLFGTGSWAVSASRAISSSNALTASFAPNYLLISSTSSMLAPYILNSQTASFTRLATGSVTASVTPSQFTVTSGSSTELQVTGTGVTIGNIITDMHTITGSLTITGSVAIGAASVGSGESNLVLGPAPAGGTGEGGQLGLLAAGGSYTSSSFIDNWQNQFRILRGPGAVSNAGLLYMDLQTGNTNFIGSVTASGGYSGLPNDYLYVTRNTDQTVGSSWANTDIIFNNSVVSKGISYNTGTGLATLTAGKVYRITARLAWSAAAAYLLEFSCYNSSNTQLGPTTQIVQSTNGSNNISDGTLDFIYAPGSNVDIKIRTTGNTTALSGEKIRGDLNTQLIIQQIA